MPILRWAKHCCKETIQDGGSKDLTQIETNSRQARCPAPCRFHLEDSPLYPLQSYRHDSSGKVLSLLWAATMGPPLASGLRRHHIPVAEALCSRAVTEELRYAECGKKCKSVFQSM